MTEETEPQEVVVTEQEPQEEHVEHVEQDVEQPVEEEKPQMVPVTAVQKERRRRKEAVEEKYRVEAELKYLKELAQKKEQPPEEDETLYESVTRGEFKEGVTTATSSLKAEVLRDVRETTWSETHSERKKYIDENLEDFLKQKPHYGSAIANAPNRYEEAYTLMSAFDPQKARKPAAPAPRKEGPRSPTSVPKAAAMDQAVDIMSLSDSEFAEWRASKRGRR